MSATSQCLEDVFLLSSSVLHLFRTHLLHVTGSANPCVDVHLRDILSTLVAVRTLCSVDTRLPFFDPRKSRIYWDDWLSHLYLSCHGRRGRSRVHRRLSSFTCHEVRRFHGDHPSPSGLLMLHLTASRRSAGVRSSV